MMAQIKAMTIEDVKDTFLHPAIDLLVSGSTGIVKVALIIFQQIFKCFRFNRGKWYINSSFYRHRRKYKVFIKAGSIPETLDQPQTLTNYYLHRINGTTSSPTYTSPVFIKTDGNLQIFANATLESLLQKEWIRYTQHIINRWSYKIIILMSQVIIEVLEWLTKD